MLAGRFSKLAMTAISLWWNDASMCRADCPPIATNLEQTFAVSSIAVRLKLNAQGTSDLPCSVEILDIDNSTVNYKYESSVPVYDVLDVFKASGEDESITVGDSVPVLYSTDTGFRLNLPDRFEDDSEGFLAYLFSDLSCFDETTNMTFAGDANVYAMSECIDHEPWQNLSPTEISLLRGELPVSSSPTTNLVTATAEPSSSPIAALPAASTSGGARNHLTEPFLVSSLLAFCGACTAFF